MLTTYATAVRDVEELAKVEWARLIVDEAQAIKNPASDTAQELRRIPARSRLALTGTPVENGLGDLWSILDFTNPGLVGPRTVFVEALSRPRPIAASGGDDAGGAAAVRLRPRPASRPCGPSTGCSSSAAPRRSRRSPPSSPTRSTSSTTAP